MKIELEQIDPNPERDFGINPIDKDQVRKLRASIRELGFWNNIVVRKHPEERGRYQLAYGHNRLEAAKKEGETTADLPVLELDDDAMKHIMDAENATQRTLTSGAAADSVASAVRRLALAIAEGNIGKLFPKSSARTVESIAGRFTERGEIGKGLVHAYINMAKDPEVERDEDDLFPLGDVQTQNALVFKSGLAAKLYRAAKKSASPEAAKRIEQAIQALGKRELVTPTLDAKLGSAFQNTHQQRVFVSTLEEMEKATGLKVPVDKQLALAEKVMAVASAGENETGNKVAASEVASRVREQFTKVAKKRRAEEDREADEKLISEQRARIERGKAVTMFLDKNTLSYGWTALGHKDFTRDEIARLRAWWSEAKRLGSTIEKL